MRYIVQLYHRYPIYEPAEGGYYYNGLEPDYGKNEHMIFPNKEFAINALAQIVNDENATLPENDIDGWVQTNLECTHAWTVNKYLGVGYEYFVEALNNRYRHAEGRKPYC